MTLHSSRLKPNQAFDRRGTRPGTFYDSFWQDLIDVILMHLVAATSKCTES